MEKILTYEAAFLELTQISRDIEGEKVTVDELATKVKRASELIAICEAKLKLTETEVTKIIKQMGSEADDSEAKTA